MSTPPVGNLIRALLPDGSLPQEARAEVVQIAREESGGSLPPEVIEQAIDDYLAANPIEGVTTQQLAAAIAAIPDPSWTEVTGKPSTFPPAGHRHDASEIDNLPAYTDTTARRNSDGSWPSRPDVSNDTTVMWVDLTDLAPADPPGFLTGVDVIIDAGVA